MNADKRVRVQVQTPIKIPDFRRFTALDFRTILKAVGEAWLYYARTERDCVRLVNENEKLKKEIAKFKSMEAKNE